MFKGGSSQQEDRLQGRIRLMMLSTTNNIDAAACPSHLLEHCEHDGRFLNLM